MASVLSESSTSAVVTTASVPSPVGFGKFQIRPVDHRIREGSFSSLALGEEPGQPQLRFNQIMSDALLGKSSSELKSAELGRVVTKTLMDPGIGQGREKRRKLAPAKPATDVDTARGDEWDSIQDYGKFLRDTADTFQVDPHTSPPPIPRIAIPASPESDRGLQETKQLGWLSWRNLRFGSDFAHLAPLTSRENRTYARQSSKLINWLSDPANDWLFLGWNGLDQAIDPPAILGESRRRQDSIEWEALEGILQDSDDQGHDTQIHGSGELGWRPVDPRGQSSFAKYLSQEAPSSPGRRLGDRVISAEPSWSSRTGGSGGVVSQDNHWRRTIFG